MRESSIESYLVRKVKEHGGLCYKFVSPGNPGVPDRIIITPTGKTVYVELKTEIGRLAKVQTVSYTHLDVYKRQGFHGKCAACYYQRRRRTHWRLRHRPQKQAPL